MSREELIATAVALGLLFEKNISSANLQKKIDEKNAKLEAQLKDVDLEIPPTVDEVKDMQIDDNALIKRETVCKSYRTKIKGFEEAARRSGVTVDEIKEAIDSGKPIGGYLFTFIG